MNIKILSEYGHLESLLGLGLSYGKTSDITDLLSINKKLFDSLFSLSNKLATKDCGHNKFLESITVYIDIKAPRYFWSQFDTFRVGITKQSESTMHTITKRYLTQDDFELNIPDQTLDTLNGLIEQASGKYGDPEYFETLKNELPEGFLQRRIVCTNYKVLRNMIFQRKNHKLKEWKQFCKFMYENLKYNCYLEDVYKS